jgi:hypothetical protein
MNILSGQRVDPTVLARETTGLLRRVRNLGGGVSARAETALPNRDVYSLVGFPDPEGTDRSFRVGTGRAATGPGFYTTALSRREAAANADGNNRAG